MGRTMKPITLVMAYYDNPSIFAVQQETWRGFSDRLRASFHVIVVDDGSPRSPALPHVQETGVASFELYRTLVDCRWNWLFCRNLGVAHAKTEWMLLTDIDHVLPEKTLRHLLQDRHDPRAVYRFARVDAPRLTPYKPHPNTWFLTRKMFDRIGGYDERFSGYYGTDGEFRDRVHRAADRVVMLRNTMIRYPRTVIADASTTTYGRKETQDRENVTRIRQERAELEHWRPLRLTFPWERLVSVERTCVETV